MVITARLLTRKRRVSFKTLFASIPSTHLLEPFAHLYLYFIFSYFDYAAAAAKGSHLRIHYKHCREIANAIKGLQLAKAKNYLEKVLVYKAAIPFTKYTGGIGRHSAGKLYKAPGDKVAWPQKATRTFLDLLTNISANATVCIASSFVSLQLLSRNLDGFEMVFVWL